MSSQFSIASPLLLLGFLIGTAGWVAPVSALPRSVALQALELPPLRPFTAYQPLPDAAPLPEAPLSESSIRLVLRLGERQVYVYRGEEAIATYPVAIGRPDTPTPTGEFLVFEMIENPAWKNPRTGEVEPAGADGSLGTRWIGFANMPNGVIGFHGTPNRASIGRAASHGCVRMRNEDVVAMFEHVAVGTVVTVEP
jgi:L,D-transpeptidase catalytic domain